MQQIYGLSISLLRQKSAENWYYNSIWLWCNENLTLLGQNLKLRIQSKKFSNFFEFFRIFFEIQIFDRKFELKPHMVLRKMYHMLAFCPVTQKLLKRWDRQTDKMTETEKN